MRILLLLFVAAVVVFLVWRFRNRDVEETGVKVRNFDPVLTDDRQIILRPGAGACAVARQQAGRSFGSEEQPRLPLPGCRASSCNCRFEIIAGRRREQRREHSDRRDSIRFEQDASDRRRKDRRKGSVDPWGVDPEAKRDDK